MHFFRSIWKNLHLTEIFYKGTACGACDKYEVCLHRDNTCLKTIYNVLFILDCLKAMRMLCLKMSPPSKSWAAGSWSDRKSVVHSLFEDVVRDLSSPKVEDELNKNVGQWNQTKPEEEKDRLIKKSTKEAQKHKKDEFWRKNTTRPITEITAPLTSRKQRVQVKGTSLASAFSSWWRDFCTQIGSIASQFMNG